MNIKSHFKFTKQQRSGIFLLLILIVVLQCIYTFVNFPSKDINVNSVALECYQAEIEALKIDDLKKRQPKMYAFNPNFITDYKGYALGMSNEEIDRLLKFRKLKQWINSAKQFQLVTKVSDSLLTKISPYFKFPDWVTNPKPKQDYASKQFRSNIKIEADKIDINTATIFQLKKVYGVGETLSKRILEYRKMHNGFASMIELQEIYGLTPKTIEEIKKAFNLKSPRTIKKVNLNTATKDQLVTIKYIDYEIAYNIIEYRTLREKYKSIDELIKVKAFPVNKFEIIRLSLTLN